MRENLKHSFVLHFCSLRATDSGIMFLWPQALLILLAFLISLRGWMPACSSQHSADWGRGSLDQGLPEGQDCEWARIETQILCVVGVCIWTQSAHGTVACTERGSTDSAHVDMVISRHVDGSDSSIHPQVSGGTSLLIRKEILGNSFYFLSMDLLWLINNMMLGFLLIGFKMTSLLSSYSK